MFTGETMIYEVRTYRHKTRQLGEFQKRFAEGYEHRKKLSPIAAAFHCDIGPLNLVMTVWPYSDQGERERIRAEAAKSEHWPPKVADLLDHQQSEIFVPLPFTPEMATGKLGPYFECRSYTLRPGAMAQMIENWAERIEERRKHSPLVIAMQTDVGALNKLVHIWAYESLDQRMQVRADMAKRGIWPPKPLPPGGLVSQETMILLPAPYSPLQ